MLSSVYHNFTRLMSCVQLPYLHIQFGALAFQHPKILYLESIEGFMYTTHHRSNVMSFMWALRM